MAAASPNIPPEKPELFGCYFQIPENAEVRRVPISTLSSLVQQRIMHLGDHIDVTEKSYVIVVSPITMQKFPNGHKASTEAAKAAQGKFGDTNSVTQSDGRLSTRKADKCMRDGHSTYLVPVKCFKDTALTILQLSQTSNEEKWSFESEFPNISDFSVLNLEGVKMKATALCMYRNIMYLLPESKKRNISNGGSDGEVEKSEGNESGPEAELGTNSERAHNGLGCVTMRRLSHLQQRRYKQVDDASEKSATAEKLREEGRWELPGEPKPTNASPPTSSSTENSSQISFMEHSKRQVKRKLSYVGNKEVLTKKLHLSDSDVNEDSPEVQNVVSGSPLQSYLSPSGSPSLESPPSLSPAPSLTDVEGRSSSSLLCNILPSVAPAPLGPGPTCGDDLSLPHPKATSSPFLLEFTGSSENSQEPEETPSFSEPSLMSSRVSSDHSSFLDMDDTIRDEVAQRLRDRVRECEKMIEAIQQKSKLS